jgi:hypothetical protein
VRLEKNLEVSYSFTMKKFLVLLLYPFAVFADPPTSSPASTEEESGAPRHYGNLRIGASSATQNNRPELCIDLAPLSYLSFESCGTGSGFLHHDPEPELAHFRTKLKVADIPVGNAWVQPQLMAGFAEMQIGEDIPGFNFKDTGTTGVSTAGAEAGASLRTLFPSKGGIEFVTEVSAAAAFLPHAPELNAPQNKVQPSLSISFGVGF